MEQNMANEVMEATEEIVTTKSGKAGKKILGIGLVVLVGGFIYKRIIKPVIAKAKAAKEDRAVIDSLPDPSEDELMDLKD